MPLPEFLLKFVEILVPAFVALVVGGVAAYISVRQIRQAAADAEKQVKASSDAAMLQYRVQVLSSNRINWIHQVRDTASELVACVDRGAYLIAVGKGLEPDFHERAMRLQGKLRLLLNLTEKESMQAFETSRNLMEIARACHQLRVMTAAAR